MKNRGIVLLIVLAVALLVVVILSQTVFAKQEQPQPAEAGQQMLDAMFDQIGVTRWAEALNWLEKNEAGTLAAETLEAMPVWVSRTGTTHFHSIPLCGGMKAPVETTLGQAVAEGPIPCSVCWTEAAN